MRIQRKKAVSDFKEFDRKNKEYAANSLLDLANEWKDQSDDDYDEEEEETNSSENKSHELTADEFMRKITISGITAYSDGGLAVAYDDGNMFLGHIIELSIEPDGSYSSADIEG